VGTYFACIKIASADVVFDCNGYSIDRNGSATDTAGIAVNGSASADYTNVTIRNCPSINGYEYNVLVHRSTNATITNVTAHNHSIYGLYLYVAHNATVTGNTFRNGTASISSGIYTLDAMDMMISDNTAYGHQDYGFYMYRSDYNEISNNTAYDNNRGIYLYQGDYNDVTDSNLTDNYYGIYLYSNANYNNLTNNTIEGSYYGIYVYTYNNRLVGNTVMNGGSRGIYVYYNYNDVINNTVSNYSYGIYTRGDYCNIMGNNVSNSSSYGIHFYSGSDYHNVTGNKAYDNDGNGFYFYSSDRNQIRDNLAYNNRGFADGLFFYSSYYNNITNNTVYGNGHAGFRIRGNSDNNNFTNNTAHSNNDSGFYIEQSGNTRILGMHAYDNGQGELFVNATTSTAEPVYLEDFIIDRPQGDYEASTNLTINDSVEGNTAYRIGWNDIPSPLPAQRIPFADKFLDISNETSGVSIDTITWHWSDGELSASDNESAFELWKNNGSWSNLTEAVRNTTANTFTLTNHNPASVYGILQEGESVCRLINESGSYKIYSNLSGAPIDAPGGKACVNIAASDVLFDCKGYGIRNNGTAGTTYGIALNGSVTNVTLKNCDGISQYTYGVYVPESNASLEGMELFNNSRDLVLNNSGGSGSMSFGMTDVLFLKPAGSLENYTNLSISDSLGAGEAYSINWSTNRTGFTSPYSSFHGKIVNISNMTGTAVSIDSITWHYTDAEAYKVSEIYLEIQKDSGSGWSDAGATVDTSANKLTLTNHNPASLYAIAEFMVMQCIAITTPNEYIWLKYDLEGSEIRPDAESSCLWVNASNVTVDCDGYNVTNNATPLAAGIKTTPTASGVTVKNCGGISNYTYGIYATGDYGLFQNITALENTKGFYLVNGTGNNVTGSTAYSNTEDGFYVFRAQDTYLEDDTANGNLFGINIYMSNITSFEYKVFTNSRDFKVNVTSGNYTVSMSEMLFLNPSGTYENYTRLTFADLVEAGESYSINWTQNTTAPPNDLLRYSVGQKYVDIGDAVGSPVIDLLRWHWLDNETGSYDEDFFEIWSYNSTNWTNENATLDTGSNWLTLINHTPESIYGVMFYDAPICKHIDSSGSYALNGNLQGAPISASPAFGWTCIKISASDVVFDCNGYNITNNDTPGSKRGILLVNPATNVTVQNCPGISGYQYVVDVWQTGGNRFNNVTAHSGTYGIRMASSGADWNNVTGCTAYNNSYGITFSYADNNTVRDSVAYNNSPYGFFFDGDADSIAINNTAYDNTNDGFSGSQTTRGTFINNTAYDNGGEGFDLTDPSYNNLTGNEAHDNSGEGFYLRTPLFFSHNTLVDNWAYNNTLNGFTIYLDSDNGLANNTAEDNGRNGFLINGTFTGGPVFSNNILVNNTGRNNGWSGFQIINDSNNTLINNSAHGNSQYGLYIQGSNDTAALNTHTYDNSLGALRVDGNASGDMTVTLAGIFVDNPAGNLENYTILSIGDDVAPNTSYTVNWSDNSTGAPTDLTPFRNKYVDITNNTPGVTIDTIVWNWLASEEAGYNVSKLQVWKYTGTWNSAGASRNTTARTLTVTNHNPASIYAMFESNISGCQEINESGVYTLDDDASGSPFNNSCVRITADNVVFDCDNHSITGTGASDTCGINLEGPLTNISIQNCPDITNFGWGICANDLNDSTFKSTSAGGNANGGIRGESCHGANFIDCHFGNNYDGGVFTDSSDLSFSQSTFNDNTNDGAHFDNVNGVDGSDCSFDNNGQHGNSIFGGGDMSFDQSTFNGNNGTGAAAEPGGGPTNPYNLMWLASLFYGNGNWGLSLDTCIGCGIQNSDATENGNSGGGALVQNSENTTIDPSTFCGGPIGVLVNNSNNTVIEDTTACNNTQYGIYILNSDNTTINGTSKTYNNSLDLFVNNTLGGAVTLNVTSLRFDNPLGNNQNYTDVAFDDSVGASTSYSMNWTVTPPSPPGNLSSFDDRFIDISGTGPIESMRWIWTDGESIGRGYDESSFDIWEHDGSNWTDMNATLDTGANTLTLLSLNPASDYGVLSSGSNLSYLELFGANVSNVSHHTRYNGTSAGNITTRGGNITGVNANSTQLTGRWAAFYGNVSGGIVLSGGASSNYVYSWNWNPSEGGVVCVSTNSSLGIFPALGANGSDIDTAWNLTSAAADSGANTFNNTNCTLDVGSDSVVNSGYADTGPAGGFMTCAVKTAVTPVKAQMVFCSEIISGGTTWNNGTGDYEVMVPTPEGTSTETYYFYANLG
jgi:parallel beta-helix repeat protein